VSRRDNPQVAPIREHRPGGSVWGLPYGYPCVVHMIQVMCLPMATRKTLTQKTAALTVVQTDAKEGSGLDLGVPIKVDRTKMPQPGKRGGRASNEPEMLRWLGILEEGQTYQMGGGDADGAHTVNRITQLRKVASKAGNFTIETSPIESGKRYLVFVTPGKPSSNGR